MTDEYDPRLPEGFGDLVGAAPASTCWVWNGTVCKLGYGRFRLQGRMRQAHRLSYERLRGPIPPGLVLDHLCRVRCCVNPAHLEAVTQRTNVLRGVGFAAKNARATHCKRGHELIGANLILEGGGRHRRCRTCDRKQPKAD